LLSFEILKAAVFFETITEGLICIEMDQKVFILMLFMAVFNANLANSLERAGQAYEIVYILYFTVAIILVAEALQAYQGVRINDCYYIS